MKNDWTLISEYLANNIYLSTQEAKKIGIRRAILAKYSKEAKRERVSRGVYTLPNRIIDEYELLQENTK